MVSQLKAVIFDLDGLLIDSEPVWHKAYEIFSKNHGVLDNPEIYQKMVGRGLKENVVMMINKMGLRGEPDYLLNELRNTFYGLLKVREGLLMSGAASLVKELRGRFKLAVATGGHAKEKCSQILKNVGINKYFDVVVSSDDVKDGKPAPDVYLETASQLAVQPLNCLVLEDAANGVLAAKAAKMKVLGVNADEKIRAELQKAGADKVYSSLTDIDL